MVYGLENHLVVSSNQLSRILHISMTNLLRETYGLRNDSRWAELKRLHELFSEGCDFFVTSYHDIVSGYAVALEEDSSYVVREIFLEHGVRGFGVEEAILESISSHGKAFGHERMSVKFDGKDIHMRRVLLNMNATLAPLGKIKYVARMNLIEKFD